MRPHESVRVFQNPILERFTHVHPITPLVLWVPVISWLLWHAFAIYDLSLFSVIWVGLLGVFVWTLTEYLLHRFVFHYPAKNRYSKRFVYLLHGLHHDDPVDPTRLVMPPIPGILIASVLFLFFRLFLGPVWVEPFFAFFLMGYLWYDYTHYATHHFTPRTSWGRMVKQHHMQHHYVSMKLRFGVSTPFWDHVFGTMRE